MFVKNRAEDIGDVKRRLLSATMASILDRVPTIYLVLLRGEVAATMLVQL